MKELSGKLFAQLHVFIFLYMLYGVWVAWDEHSMTVTDLQSRLETIERNTADSRRRLTEIEEFVKKIDEYQLRVEEVAKNIETVQKQLPSTTNDSEIISFFNQEIDSLNMKEANMNPGEEKQLAYFISKNYSMSAKGTYLQFLVFFERIGTASRIFNVPELSLKVISDNKRGRFQMIEGSASIQAYRYNPGFKVERGFTNPPTGEKK